MGEKDVTGGTMTTGDSTVTMMTITDTGTITTEMTTFLPPSVRRARIVRTVVGLRLRRQRTVTTAVSGLMMAFVMILVQAVCASWEPIVTTVAQSSNPTSLRGMMMDGGTMTTITGTLMTTLSMLVE